MTFLDLAQRATSAIEAIAEAAGRMAKAAETATGVLEAYSKPLVITTPHPSWVDRRAQERKPQPPPDNSWAKHGADRDDR